MLVKARRRDTSFQSHVLREDVSTVTVLANARATVEIHIVPKRRAVQFVPEIAPEVTRIVLASFGRG